MIALIRLALFGFLGLTALYYLLSVYSRSLRREELEDEWAAGKISDSEGDEAARDAYIEAGMRDYERGLRKKLIWLVYVIPIIVIAVTVYLVNYQ